MAASKRDFVNFDQIPGELCNNIHQFPTLWKKDSRKAWRKWSAFVRLINRDQAMIETINWNLTDEKTRTIKPEYYNSDNKLSDTIIAESWTETGIETGCITRSMPAYYCTIMNKGKKNERSVFHTALITVRAAYLDKIAKGYSETKAIKSNDSMYFPMLAKTFKDGEKSLRFPLYVQPKLDGVRCLVYLNNNVNNVENVIAYTRTKKEFPSVDYLKELLLPYLLELFDGVSIYLDGELYKHGKSLQEISGTSRNAATSSNNANEYHIYDCFYPDRLDMDFKDRYAIIKRLNNMLKPADKKYIKCVSAKKVADLAAATIEYNRYTELGYEGAMLRNVTGPYLANNSATGSTQRSGDLVKLKPLFTDEFEIIGYTDGNGKDKGAVIWICRTNTGHTFNVTPKGIDYAERYRLFEECEDSFEDKFKGKMMTVEYQDVSENGVPLRAKAVVIRDYE